MQQLAASLLTAAALLPLSVAPAIADTYTKLYSYPNTDNNTSGITWPSVLSQGQDGDFYSTIETNGAHNYGSVYRMSTGGAYHLLYSFCPVAGCADGGYPEGGVTLGFDGNFWGTAAGGGKDGAGTIFKMTFAGKLTPVYSFTNGKADSAPIYTVIQGQDDNLYGVSEEQYEGQYGAFFKLTTGGKISPYPLAYHPDGASPNLPVQGTDGNFYGTSQLGGDKSNCGLIYKVTSGGQFTVLHTFKGFDGSPEPWDGCRPYGTLVEGKDGNFYGTTYQGGDNGTNNGGVVFKITPRGTYTIVHSFVWEAPAYDGQTPTAGLTLGTDGNFYGVTTRGGSKGGGAIYEITAAGKEKVLYSFCTVSCYDGFSPTTPLVLHTDGKLYGTTSGNSLGGSVFYSFNVGLKPFVKLVTWMGKAGAKAQILGQGFTGTTAVSFDGVAAKFDNVSDTYLTATVPSGARTGSVTVTTFGGSLASDRNFLVTPEIESFTPADAEVGSSITITGLSLTQTTAVTIGGTVASFKVDSNTELTATVPAGAKTGEKIIVTTAGGSASSSEDFAVVPKITSFSPASGPVGTAVTISGHSFTGTTKVTFDGLAAKSYEVTSDTQVDALVPTGATTGTIAVTTAGGTGISAGKFTVKK